MNDCTVILADGNFPSSEHLLDSLKNAAHLVCCDGAAAHVLAIRTPDAIVGDMDTLCPELQEKFAAIIHREKEQETNDLCKAFRFCLARGWRNMEILGATGGREDHMLGNLGQLVSFSREIPDIRMLTDHGEFSVAWQSGDFESFPGQAVSIFAPVSGTEITSAGLKYPMQNLRIDFWWQATLNEALADSFQLDFPAGFPVLIFKRYRKS